MLFRIIVCFGLLVIQVINNIRCADAQAQDKNVSSCLINSVGKHAGKMYKVNCTGLKLDSVPSCNQLPVACHSVVELILKNNLITNLTEGWLQNYTNVKQLDLTSNPIKQFNNGSFQGLSNLLSLDLSGMHDVDWLVAVQFESGTFNPLTSIKILILSGSMLNVSSLFSALCHVNKNIQELILDGINFYEHHVISFDQRFTECLAKLDLKKLSLSDNYIGSITLAASLNLRMLEYFAIPQNEIVVDDRIWYLLPVHHNLTYFDFSCQFNYGCSEVYPFASILPGAPMLFHEETILNISVNPLKSNTVSLFFLSKLHTLKLSYVPIEAILPSFCWAGNHLVNLDLSHTRKIKTAGVLDCIYFLRYLNLRHVSPLTLSVEVFHGMPSLEVLMLGSSGIKQGKFPSRNATKLFEKNRYLKFLDLSDLGLTSLPKNFFYHQHQLKTLILNQNKFTTI